MDFFSEFFDDLKLYSKKLGVLNEINIYPLDGAYRLDTTIARCFKEGLVNSSLSRGPVVPDRFLIAYSPTTKKAILDVNEPGYSTPEVINELLNAIKSPHNDFFEREKLEIKYLGNPMMVEDLGDRVAIIVRRLYRMEVDEMRLAVCTPENRLKFEAERTHFSDSTNIFNVDKLSSYYSPYTLVSSSSIKCLENLTKTYVPAYRFHANLVLNGSEPFVEDDSIFCLKIGANVFSNILPCTYTPYTFLNKVGCNKNPELLEPYRTLKKYRTLKNLRPEYHRYHSPAFGINMSLVSKSDVPIRLGDAITAYYLY